MAEAPEELRRLGRRERVRFSRTKPGTPFAHLKVVVPDGQAAHVESANVTGVAVAFVWPWVACAVYTAVALIWLIPDPRIEGVLSEPTQAT